MLISYKGLCLNHLDLNPFSGTVFAFTNQARTSVKLLVYDANGFGYVKSDLANLNLLGGQHQMIKPNRLEPVN